jgi:hypothetical protein
MNRNIIIKVLILGLGRDTQKFLNGIQTAEDRMPIEIYEARIHLLSRAVRTWNLVQYDRSLSMLVWRGGKSIVDAILHLLAV